MKENVDVILCRVLAVLDTYDAMTFDRTYRKALSKYEALEEINIFSGI
ncbi:MAG: hypothetical protein ACERKV_02105 [Clostridiaceae bacterium]